jgi:hypothetical protein
MAHRKYPRLGSQYKTQVTGEEGFLKCDQCQTYLVKGETVVKQDIQLDWFREDDDVKNLCKKCVQILDLSKLSK